MDIIKKFLPQTFKTLSFEEKKENVINLVNYICDEFKIEHIPVLFDIYMNEENDTIAGKLCHNPLHISINYFYINDFEKLKFIESKNIDYDVGVSYYLVHTIAHECYHYYQTSLVKKLINGIELSEEEKISAYAFFVSLYDKLFSSFNKRFDIYKQVEISPKELYCYSSTELSANVYATDFIENLGKIDSPNNLFSFRIYMLQNSLSKIIYNAKTSGDLIEKSLMHSYQNAIAFLNYKNRLSGLSTPYLGIDTNELKFYLTEALKKCQKIDKHKNNFYNKIFKK